MTVRDRLAKTGPKRRSAVWGQLRRCARRNHNSLFKTEMIHRRGPWRSVEAVVGEWFNTRRLIEPSETFRKPRRSHLWLSTR